MTPTTRSQTLRKATEANLKMMDQRHSSQNRENKMSGKPAGIAQTSIETTTEFAPNINAPNQSRTWLDIVDIVDNVPYFDTRDPEAYTNFFNKYWKFCIFEPGLVAGYMPPSFITDVAWTKDFVIDNANNRFIMELKDSMGPAGIAKARPDPSLAMKKALDFLLSQGVETVPFTKFHAKMEAYPVINSPEPFGIDRHAARLFGIVTAGAHLTAYSWVSKEETQEMRLWIPRRAYNKSRDPGMLDNSVAGGIAIGMSPRDVMIQEADEEAALDPRFVSENLRAAGTVSYFHQGKKYGDLQPRIRFVFDLELPEGMIPTPKDGEVEDFRSWSISETMEALKGGQFKIDAAIIWLDFFIRHGIITPENEPQLPEIVARIHRKLPFDMKYNGKCS